MSVEPVPEWSQGAFDAAFEEQANEIGRFNLAVFGKTGVGKSTLINAMFGENVALTGIGRPVTQGSHLYVHRTGKLGIYDTQGLEVGRDTDKILGEMKKFLDHVAKQPFVEQVHLAWYCVRANDRRFEQTEADFVTRMVELGLPVVLVMTQVPARFDVEGTLYIAPDALELAREISHMGLPVYQNRAILVNALADRFLGVDQHGLAELLDATFHLAPDAATTALTAAQKIDPARKAAAAEAAITKATAAAAAAGFTPIPFADAAVLVPIQIGMMARIANIYDIPMDRATVASLAATTAATQAGRFTATGLLKMVPGVGTLVGGSITAGVAGAITYSVGGAWHRVCAGMSAGKYGGLTGALDSKAVQRVFNAEFAAMMRRKNIGVPK